MSQDTAELESLRIEPSGQVNPMPLHEINERSALGYALASVLLWSTVATAFKLGLKTLEPLQMLWLGSCFSLLFFALYAWATGALHLIRACRPKDLAKLAFMGVLNPFLYYLLLFEAYDRLPAQIAQPLNYTWAITLALLAVPLLKQPLTRWGLLGMIVSYMGVLILLSGGENSGGLKMNASLDLVGIFLALASTLVWAGYWLTTTRFSYHPAVLMSISFTVGTPLVGLACLMSTGLPSLTLSHLGYGAWVGLVEMGVTFLMWHQALKKTRHAGRIGQLIFLAPFISLLLINYVLGESVQGTSVLGLIGIVAGLVIARRSPTRTFTQS